MHVVYYLYILGRCQPCPELIMATTLKMPWSEKSGIHLCMGELQLKEDTPDCCVFIGDCNILKP